LRTSLEGSFTTTIGVAPDVDDGETVAEATSGSTDEGGDDAEAVGTAVEDGVDAAGVADVGLGFFIPDPMRSCLPIGSGERGFAKDVDAGDENEDWLALGDGDAGGEAVGKPVLEDAGAAGGSVTKGRRAFFSASPALAI
jgi:hypothetical protein